MRIVTGEEMQKIDQMTIEEVGITGIVLMEQAGYNAAVEISKVFKTRKKVLIISGKGNNGGDGFVIHRWLERWGYECTTLLLASRKEIKGDARVNLEILHKLQADIVEVEEITKLWEFWKRIDQFSLIIDGVLGTGLKGEVRGLSKEVIELINHVPQEVISIDIPSGLDALRGKPLGVAVKARLTVTFGAPKLGLLMYPGRDYVGELRVIDIGIPEQVLQNMNVQRHLADEALCRKFLPFRPVDGHKGTFGRVAVLAGSVGMTGAAALTAKAALRSGAGLVTLGIPASLNPIMESKLTEVMTIPLAETGGQFALESLEKMRKMMAKADVLTAGPGMGQSEALQRIMHVLLEEVSIPLVIDADGLNNLRPSLELLKKREELTVLTPHPGEMARLMGMSVGEVLEDRVGIAESFAQEYGVVVVLKGAPTVVALPDGKLYLNTTGNQGMGTGGSGDVLTGIISGLLAQKPDPLSVVCGVFLHGLAGDLYADKFNSRSLIAGDLLKGLPLAFNKLEKKTGDDI